MDLSGALSRTLLQQLPEGAVVTRASDRRIVLANAAAQRILGLDLEGRSATDAQLQFMDASGQILPAEEQPLLKPLYGLGAVNGLELQLVGGDGRLVNILLNAAPVHADDGRLVGVIALFQDIGQRKALERLRDEFLSVAGHELRTPMASLKGWGQYTQMRLERGKVADPTPLLAHLNRQISRLEILLDQMLDTAQIETQRMQLDEAEFDLCECLRAAILTLPPEWLNRVVFRRRQPVWLVGDRSRMERVVLNLLTNALKYSDPESRVRLLAFRRADDVLICVGDRGVGIPDADLPHIFERFYRAPNSSHSAGLGLGLYISKQIVERHGGELRVRSEQRRGTVFTVTLPLKVAPDSAAGRVREPVSITLPEIPPRE